jgi:hypothetical protein
MSALFDEFENQNLVDALKLRACVFKGDKSVTIQDARAKLELACSENDKYAWYFKGRALKYGGFGYHKESWPHYEEPYANAKALGCTWIGGEEEIQETQGPRAVCYLHNQWYLSDFYDEYDLFLYEFKNETKSLTLNVFISALNGNEMCACKVIDYIGNELSNVQFCEFAITSRSTRVKDVLKQNDSACNYLIGQALTYDNDQARLYDRFGLTKDEAWELRMNFKKVNTNCQKSVLTWLGSGLLIKDLRVYIGKLIWNNRAKDAGDWLN